MRLIGIPAVAVAGVLIYRGLRRHFFLPECDSESAKHTLADVLKQFKLEPARYEPIKTVSSTKDESSAKRRCRCPMAGASPWTTDFIGKAARRR